MPIMNVERLLYLCYYYFLYFGVRGADDGTNWQTYLIAAAADVTYIHVKFGNSINFVVLKKL